MSDTQAFVVTQVGEKGSVERKRADEISDYIIQPILKEFDLRLQRSDRDPTPGRVTAQILRSLLEARVVIADLTGRNPNVYYELAVAHAFGRPVVVLVDKAESLAFDTKDERVIELGEYGSALSVPQAEEGKKRLRDSLTVLLSDDFKPSSLVTEVAAARSLDQLAPENPVASELAAIRETLEELRATVRPRAIVPPNVRSEARALRNLVELLVNESKVSPQQLADLVDDDTSNGYDRWVAGLVSGASKDPWATGVSVAALSDEAPF